MMTRADGQQQGELHVVHRRTNGDRAVIKSVDSDCGRDMLFQPGQQLLDAVHDRNRIGPGCF